MLAIHITLKCHIKCKPDLGFNGSEITLESTETALKGDDPSQIIAQFIGRLNQLRLVTNPRLNHHKHNAVIMLCQPGTDGLRDPYISRHSFKRLLKAHLFTTY